MIYFYMLNTTVEEKKAFLLECPVAILHLEIKIWRVSWIKISFSLSLLSLSLSLALSLSNSPLQNHNQFP